MEKKQTAVQKLIEHLEETYHLTEETRNEFNQALQMEREQIEEAYKAALPLDDNPDYMSNKYYTQTFTP